MALPVAAAPPQRSSAERILSTALELFAVKGYDATSVREICAAADITAYLNGLGLVLDIDNNGALDPLTDGLLVLRFMFGFTGASLTNNAVAGNCVTRCDPATILAYLQTLD